MLKSARQRFSFSWLKVVAIVLVSLGFIFLLYGWRLGTLVPGLSPAEVAAVADSAQPRAIYQNPLNAPHKLLQYGAGQISGDNWALRLPSVAFALAFLGLFYVTLRLWFGRWVGLLGALLFAGTPWLIIIARSATPDILLLMPIAMLASALWLSRRNSARAAVWLGICAAAALSLYVPGVVWIMLAVLIFKYRAFRVLAGSMSSWLTAAGGLLFIILLAPLLWGLAQNPQLAKELLLIPDPLRAPLDIVKTTAWSALSLVWRLGHVSDFTVGRLPLLTIAQLALAAFGGYALWSKARSVLYWLGAIVVVSVVAAGLNDRLTLLLPAIMAACIMAAAGLRYLYVEWNTIFPRNPIPRTLALVLMVVVVGLHLAYGVRYALIAWPNAPLTNQVYMLK